jgi:hypothetical protein
MSDVRSQSNTCKAHTIFFLNGGIFNSLYNYTDRHKKRLIMISLIKNLEIIFVLFFFIIVKLGYFQ